LQAIARAEQSGDDSAIRSLVRSRSVADKIIAYGRQVRARAVRSLHIAPSLTIGPMTHSTDEVVFSLVGRTNGGRITAPQQVYVLVGRGTPIVVGDQPGEAW
jgi:hypothetical protein